MRKTFNRVNEDFLDSEDIRKDVRQEDVETEEYVLEPEKFDTCMILCMNTIYFFNRYINALRNLLLRYTSKYRLDILDGKHARYYIDDQTIFYFRNIDIPHIEDSSVRWVVLQFNIKRSKNNFLEKMTDFFVRLCNLLYFATNQMKDCTGVDMYQTDGDSEMGYCYNNEPWCNNYYYKETKKDIAPYVAFNIGNVAAFYIGHLTSGKIALFALYFMVMCDIETQIDYNPSRMIESLDAWKEKYSQSEYNK